VKHQEAQPDSTLQLTRRLLALRRAHPALRLGNFRTLAAEDGLLVFERSHAGDRLLIAANLGAQEREWQLEAETSLSGILLQLKGCRMAGNRVHLSAGSAMIGKLEAVAKP
jgi:glycosidase